MVLHLKQPYSKVRVNCGSAETASTMRADQAFAALQHVSHCQEISDAEPRPAESDAFANISGMRFSADKSFPIALVTAGWKVFHRLHSFLLEGA